MRMSLRVATIKVGDRWFLSLYRNWDKKYLISFWKNVKMGFARSCWREIVSIENKCHSRNKKLKKRVSGEMFFLYSENLSVASRKFIEKALNLRKVGIF